MFIFTISQFAQDGLCSRNLTSQTPVHIAASADFCCEQFIVNYGIRQILKLTKHLKANVF